MMFGNHSAATNGPGGPNLSLATEASEPELSSELRIVEAVSLVTVPEHALKSSNIPRLIEQMSKAQASVASETRGLSRLRAEKGDNNFIVNWWNDQDDKIQDAQLRLNQAIGDLTSRSSDLLILNTAMAKILHDQQRHLVQQQLSLKGQADEIAGQNEQIKEQQLLLEKNQRDINLANQGLLEAKGLTQAQAQQLVGCVRRVESAEDNILEAHGRLLDEVHGLAAKSAAACADMVQASLAQFKDAHVASERRMVGRLSAHKDESKNDLNAAEERCSGLSRKVDSLLKVQAGLTAKASEHEGKLRAHRIVLACASIAAIGAIAWLAVLQSGFAH